MGSSGFEFEDGTEHYWMGEHSVRLAELFEKEEDGEKTIYQVRDEFGDLAVVDYRPACPECWGTGRIPGGDKTCPKCEGKGWDGELILNERKIERYAIYRYLISGGEIIEDRQKWVSDRYWPVIPFDGATLNIDGKTHKLSLIRYSKDATRAYNYSRSTEIEMFALAPKSPIIGTAKQIGPYKAMWDQAHRRSYAYLLYDYDAAAPTPPHRLDGAPITAAITQSSMQARQ